MTPQMLCFFLFAFDGSGCVCVFASILVYTFASGAFPRLFLLLLLLKTLFLTDLVGIECDVRACV
jgi:hypothetical protein